MLTVSYDNQYLHSFTYYSSRIGSNKGDGNWLIKVEQVTDTEELLDAAAYEAFCAQEG